MQSDANETNNPEEKYTLSDPINCEIQLLVEGKDDLNFFSRLLDHLKIKNIQIQSIEGNDKLRKFIKNFVMESNFEIVKGIGIVLDADDKPASSTLEKVKSSLRDAHLPVPERAGELFGDEIKTGVFILPDNQNPGMLETLIWNSIEDEKMRECIGQFIECVKGAPSGNLDRLDKSRIHAYIAAQREPHVSVGFAAKKGYWNFDHPVFSGIKDFVRKLSKAGARG